MPDGLNPSQVAQWNQSQAEIARRDAPPQSQPWYSPPKQGPVRDRFVGPQNPMQPPVNLSGMQGAPTAQGMGIAGMIPGFGGMAAQGYMAALGKGYQAAKQGTGMQAAYQGPQNMIPSPQNSLQAGMNAMGNPMNANTASQSNGYYAPPDSVNQGRAYGLTIPMDLAGQQNRIENQNPMYEGMQGRFGAGSVMGQQAATIAAGDAGVADGTMIDIPGSYGEMPTYIQKGQEPTVSYGLNAQGNRVSGVASSDPVLKRQFDSLRNFKPNAKLGANRKAAREATKARLTESRFKMMVGKGMNPNSPQAKAMFPNQTGGGLNKNNPMVAAGPPGSIEDRTGAASQVQQDLTSNPHLLALGMTPESTMSDLNSAVGSHLDNGGTLTDESLKALQQHAMAQLRLVNKENDPFQFGQSSSASLESGMWRMLASAPDTPEARAQWANVFSARKAALAAQQEREYDNLPRTKPSATTNPGYAAPLAPTAY